MGAAVAPTRFSLVSISIPDLVADGKSLVKNSGVGGGGQKLILRFWVYCRHFDQNHPKTVENGKKRPKIGLNSTRDGGGAACGWIAKWQTSSDGSHFWLQTTRTSHGHSRRDAPWILVGAYHWVQQDYAPNFDSRLFFRSLHVVCVYERQILGEVVLNYPPKIT